MSETARDSESHSDIHYRDGLSAFQDVLGERTQQTLHTSTLCMFKPEVIVSRKVKLGCSLLKDAGFSVRSFSFCLMDRNAIREVWYHDWPRLDLHSLDIMEFHYHHARSILLFLRIEPDVLRSSASEVLSSLKGGTNLYQSLGNDIRRKLNALNAPMTFIHVPDNTCEYVRQSCVLLPRKELKRAAYCLIDENEADVDPSQICSAAYQLMPEHDLTVSNALARISQASVPDSKANCIGQVLQFYESINHGKRCDKKELFTNLLALDGYVDRWDLRCLFAAIPGVIE